VGADKQSSSGTTGCSGSKTEATGFDISKCPEKGEMSEECRKAREAEAKAKADAEKMAPKPGGGG
jgi:hypothetical protein